MQKNTGKRETEVTMLKHSDFCFLLPRILLHFSFTEMGYCASLGPAELVSSGPTAKCCFGRCVWPPVADAQFKWIARPESTVCSGQNGVIKLLKFTMGPAGPYLKLLF